jgi:hypothetical protein
LCGSSFAEDILCAELRWGASYDERPGVGVSEGGHDKFALLAGGPHDALALDQRDLVGQPNN